MHENDTVHPVALNPFDAMIINWMSVSFSEWTAFGTKARNAIRLQAFAVILLPIWFGLAMYGFATNVLKMNEFKAISLALIAGGVLCFIDRYQLIAKRGTATGGMNWAVRIVSFVMLAGAGLFQVAISHQTDIASHLNDSINTHVKELANDPRYKSTLASAKTELAAAENADKLAAKLNTDIVAADENEAKEREEYRNQCEGNTTKDGRTRIEGCKEHARAALAAAERWTKEAKNKKTMVDELGDTKTRLENATTSVKNLEEKMQEEAKTKFSGSSRQMDALLSLLGHDTGAQLAIGFWMIFSMLPEALMWIAFARTANESVLQRAFTLEKDIENVKFDKLENDLRNIAGRNWRPFVVHSHIGAASSQGGKPYAADPSDDTRQGVVPPNLAPDLDHRPTADSTDDGVTA